MAKENYTNQGWRLKKKGRKKGHDGVALIPQLPFQVLPGAVHDVEETAHPVAPLVAMSSTDKTVACDQGKAVEGLG